MSTGSVFSLGAGAASTLEEGPGWSWMGLELEPGVSGGAFPIGGWVQGLRSSSRSPEGVGLLPGGLQSPPWLGTWLGALRD